MEFWGAEVKSGETLKVEPGEDMVLHLSQACIGEIKKGNESICLFVNVNGKKLVLSTLFSEKLPQQQFDLVFDTDFELSHNWKSGSVYFYGYKASNPFEEEMSGESSGEESEEDIPLVDANNGKPEPKAKVEKPVEADKATASKSKESAGKQKVKIVEPNPEDDDTDDSLSEDGDDSEDEDDSDDESDESEEETPQKAEPSKKRASESATKTPVQDKKAKVTPQKTDGKKVGGHVATPHPAKKSLANKPNAQTPQSGAQCKTCSRTFGSEKALDSHTKAKHSASK